VIDESKQLLEIKQNSSLTIISTEKNNEIKYEFGKYFHKNNKSSIGSNQISSVKINNSKIEIVDNITSSKNNLKKQKTKVKSIEIICTKTEIEEETKFNYQVMLKGADKYIIEVESKVILDLNEDNIIYFKSPSIFSKLKVDFHLTENTQINFKKCGTIKEFSVKRNNNNHLRYHCDGIIYTEQGHMLFSN
jgi:hypothetical protein